MNLEDMFLVIRRVDQDPYPPTEPLKEIRHEVGEIVRHVQEMGCIILQEYYVPQKDDRVMLFFGWEGMSLVESFVCSIDDAKRICDVSFGRRSEV